MCHDSFVINSFSQMSVCFPFCQSEFVELPQSVFLKFIKFYCIFFLWLKENRKMNEGQFSCKCEGYVCISDMCIRVISAVIMT